MRSSWSTRAAVRQILFPSEKQYGKHPGNKTEMNLGVWIADADLIRSSTCTEICLATLQFSSATYNVNENGSSATITITRTGGSAGSVGAHFATSNGTATAGSDYTAVTQTVLFANGDATNKTVAIPILDDMLVEANETVNLTLSSPTGGATLGNPATAVLTIIDNDAPGTLQFSTATYSVNENGGSATITITRTGGSAGSVGAILQRAMARRRLVPTTPP